MIQLLSSNLPLLVDIEPLKRSKSQWLEGLGSDSITDFVEVRHLLEAVLLASNRALIKEEILGEVKIHVEDGALTNEETCIRHKADNDSGYAWFALTGAWIGAQRPGCKCVTGTIGDFPGPESMNSPKASRLDSRT